MRTQNFSLSHKKRSSLGLRIFSLSHASVKTKKKTSFSKENMIKKSRLPEAREIQVTDLLTAPQFHPISFLIGLGGSTFFFFFFTQITKLCLINIHLPVTIDTELKIAPQEELKSVNVAQNTVYCSTHRWKKFFFC